MHRQGVRPLSKSLSVLLASASSGGTIAAARHLGANGFDVRVLSSQRLAAAAWSHHTARTYSAPPESESQRFLERLLAIGAADPGQILLPTSDETAWMYAENAALLVRHFCMYQPSIATLQRILDKKLFADAAIRAGLTVLPSWDPRNIDDVEALAPTLPYPILIKPRTHVHRLRNDKGVVVYSPRELINQYQRFVDREQARAGNDQLLRDANLPILQQFVRVGNEGVHSVTGFIDRTGELFVAREASKVLQRSQPVGVGLCFESLPPTPALSDAVRRLCRDLEYFGIFEVEFLWFDGRWAVIDFNPRLFNQIGMDIRRGMPLPLLACLDASGDTASLREAVGKAQAQDNERIVFCDGFALRAILFAQTVTGRISPKDRAYWRAWMQQHAAHAVDFAADDSDPMPGIIHALSEIYLGLKSFPRFLRSTPRASSQTPQPANKGAVVSKVVVAIIGAGPYGLSLAAHLAARNIEHRIFGRPMQFWSDLAEAGGERYLKSYCFGTNISTPTPGYSFANYSEPRRLETFEPCAIRDFAAYGRWFQQEKVPWVEPVEVELVDRQADSFAITLADGQRFVADRVVIATGLTGFAYVPPAIAALPPALATHTSRITSFAAFRGCEVAVIGAGQSALEAAALLHEAGAKPQLLVRENSILWQTRVSLKRSFWRRLRSPISGLGTGPKAWGLTHFPGAMHRVPAKWRANFVKNHLPAEGAWWLRDRVEKQSARAPFRSVGYQCAARRLRSGAVLKIRQAKGETECQLVVDHVIAGSGYDIDVERLGFIHPKLRCAIERLERAPKLNAPILRRAYRDFTSSALHRR